MYSTSFFDIVVVMSSSHYFWESDGLLIMLNTASDVIPDAIPANSDIFNEDESAAIEMCDYYYYY